MIVEVRDETSLVIRPESVAEQTFLERFVGVQIQWDSPAPFQPNVGGLLLKVRVNEGNNGNKV